MLTKGCSEVRLNQGITVLGSTLFALGFDLTPAMWTEAVARKQIVLVVCVSGVPNKMRASEGASADVESPRKQKRWWAARS